MNMTLDAQDEQAILFSSLQQLRESEAPGFMVDWAALLDSSEGALQACRVGREKVWPLKDILAVLKALPSLGRVLALTRNQGVVNEYKGIYPKPQLGEAGQHAAGIFLDIGGLDLRLFMGHWHWGCAIEEETAKGKRLSLQFFDKHGSAVHKIFSLEETDLAAWQQLVNEQAITDKTAALPSFTPAEPVAHPAPVSPNQVAEEWRQMKDVHQFFSLIRRHRITRFSAVQAVPEDLSREVSVDAFQQVVDATAEQKMEIMIFVGSRGCVQIYTGKTQGIKPMRGWLNIFEENFTLHANPDSFFRAFVTRKPQSSGWVTSLEVFDKFGTLLLQMYAKREENGPEQAAWTELLTHLPSVNTSVK
ncbi:hemin-degrading factor [Marinospirillum insulare]|uniref:Hemin-degrading factor n=1 Tax=Marinospirillum insulare TaxID=217169 RepID=A0ABQ5ZVK3_9GAMM|nr:hemin-degrading factor [Marinospirillum insulare]GLR62701.1 hemin-degrading factor [Marinospirillum insulare]